MHVHFCLCLICCCQHIHQFHSHCSHIYAVCYIWSCIHTFYHTTDTVNSISAILPPKWGFTGAHVKYTHSYPARVFTHHIIHVSIVGGCCNYGFIHVFNVTCIHIYTDLLYFYGLYIAYIYLYIAHIYLYIAYIYLYIVYTSIYKTTFMVWTTTTSYLTSLQSERERNIVFSLSLSCLFKIL
jgi:hypothetical protein